MLQGFCTTLFALITLVWKDENLLNLYNNPTKFCRCSLRICMEGLDIEFQISRIMVCLCTVEYILKHGDTKSPKTRPDHGANQRLRHVIF